MEIFKPTVTVKKGPSREQSHSFETILTKQIFHIAHPFCKYMGIIQKDMYTNGYNFNPDDLGILMYLPLPTSRLTSGAQDRSRPFP